MKPLDFVKTPKGAIALIKEMNCKDRGDEFSIIYLGGGNPTGEKNAWWSANEGLEVIDNLASLLARNLVHPFGSGLNPAIKTYPIK